MSATPVISMLAARAGLDAITALLTTTSHIKIYTGAMPATTLTSEGGTLLSTLAFSSTAFPASTDGTSNGLATATANAITSDPSAANTGTAGHFRCWNNSSVTIMQGTCGTSSADMIMNTTSITAGDIIACSSFVATLADGTGSD